MPDISLHRTGTNEKPRSPGSGSGALDWSGVAGTGSGRSLVQERSAANLAANDDIAADIRVIDALAGDVALGIADTDEADAAPIVVAAPTMVTAVMAMMAAVMAAHAVAAAGFGGRGESDGQREGGSRSGEGLGEEVHGGLLVVGPSGGVAGDLCLGHWVAFGVQALLGGGQ